MMISIFNENFPCKTSLFVTVFPNSSVSSVITPCLAFALLPSILTIFSILCLLFLFFYGYVNFPFDNQIIQTKLVMAKKILGLIICCTSLAQIILYFVQSNNGLPPEFLVGKISIFIFAITSSVSYFRCCNNGIPSSMWLHLVYFFRLLSMIPETIVAIYGFKLNFMFLIFFGIETVAVVFLTIIFCFADKFEECYSNNNNNVIEKHQDPDRGQSSLARAFFAQGFYLMSKGYQRTIDYKTFWSLDIRNDPQTLLAEYHKCFNNTNISGNHHFPWLLKILLKVKWLQFCASMFLSLLFSLFVITDPLLLKLIIASNENRYPLWCGFTLVFITCLTTFIRFITSARSDFYTLLIFTDIQSILINVIYQKMLKLPAEIKAKYSAGQIVNFFTTDINMIRTLVYSMPEFISTVVTIVCCLIGLYFVIGINVLYGVAILVLILPINLIGFTLSSIFQQKQMKFKDERLRLVSDILSGIKILKFYAWEKPMREMVRKNRRKEMTYQRYMLYCSSLTGIAFNAYPIIATVVSLIGYLIIQGHPLTPQTAFLSLMLFNLMRSSVYRLPNLFQNVINARISFKRVQTFLLEPEISELLNTMKPSGVDNVIEMRNASFSWKLQNCTLNSLTLQIKSSQLHGIIGRVGSGKSSLLSAICGELYHVSGDFYRDNSLSIAYIPQEPWIQNLSLRDNILFGKAFDETFYRGVIYACALQEDLKMLSAGDETEIGERGISLSGGQKARVALARAIYQDADIYILDDILSAVDSHVGAHIFKHVLDNSSGMLRNKTRIFALNSIGFLSRCDNIMVMKDGYIVDAGTFDELTDKRNETFMGLIKDLASKASEEEAEKEKPLKIPIQYSNEEQSLQDPSCEPTDIALSIDQNPILSADNAKLIKEEKLAIGKVSFKMYWYYVKAFGIILALAYFITLFVIRTILESYSQVWMSKWSSQSSSNSNDSHVTNIEGLEIYAAFGLSSCIVIGISSIIMAFGSYYASTKLYDSLLTSLLRSPMEFFNVTPMGRVLNRLSNDIETIDFAISKKLGYVAKVAADCVFYTLSAAYVMPQLLIAVIPVTVLAMIVVRFYTITVAQIRRLASKSWSLVLSEATESYVGASSIRIFKAQKYYCKKVLQKGKTTAEAWLAENVANRWMMIVMDTITTLFSLAFTAGAIYFGHINVLTSGSVALVASTGTMLRGLLGEITRQMNNLEMSLVAVERVQEYIENEHEAEWISNIPLSPSWPNKGDIRFENFSLRYRSTLPLVLKNLNVEIQGKERIGIVGRTGAGKSSLTMAIFRMIEPVSGTIFIDNVDFRTLGLHQLRNALTIIPQDPVLFCGDLRINLDPFNEFDDAKLWKAIEKAHLKQFVESFPNMLNHPISEGGGNLSIGQRQLICLARAILRQQTKILILDEATASMDVETDQLIQSSIRTQFNDCTILTIAHRLNTIMDYDKILALDDGKIIEFDSPQKLLQNKNGLFYSLAKEAKLVF